MRLEKVIFDNQLKLLVFLEMNIKTLVQKMMSNGDAPNHLFRDLDQCLNEYISGTFREGKQLSSNGK